MTEGLIDLHQHARPAAYFEALAATGRTTVGGRAFPPAWTEDGALAMMDRMSHAAAVVSAPDADLLYRERPTALRISRLLNDLYAGLIARRPDRFGAFASLPMPHLDDALSEMAHALDTLGLDGVMLSTSYEGQFLGDACYDVLLAELDRRAALVFVHPVTPMGIERLALEFPASLLEYAFDTTRCIANLIRAEVPRRFPRVRFVFSHAGGVAPFLVPRLSLMGAFGLQFTQPELEARRGRIVAALRHFHYDIAMSASAPVLRLLADVVGADRLVFGSDWPLVPEAYVKDTADALAGATAHDEAQRRRVMLGNALALLPRLARAA